MVLACVELGSACPCNLTFFNQLLGGPQNGLKYLADSNLDWASI